MKASEVLKRYAAGERNFQGVNLRGQSFKGKDLSEADFSKADIRSANFTDAQLRGTNFSGAEAGLQKKWVVILLLFSWFIEILAGFFATFSSFGFLFLFSNYAELENNEATITSLILLFIIIIFFYSTIRKSLVAGIGSFGVAFGVIFGIAFGIAFGLAEAVEIADAVGVGFSVAFGLAGAIGVGVIGAVGFAIAVTVEGLLSVVIGVAAIVVVAFIVAIKFGVPVAFADAGGIPFIVASTFVLAFTFTFAFLFAYIGFRAMKRSEQDVWIRSIAIAFAAIGGTSFRGADLTDANFTEAQLKNTDFRESILIRSCWKQAKQLKRVRPGTSYLNNSKIRQLITTGKGQNQNFNNFDLRGINLQGANLENAKFIDADFYQANLKEANLSRAILVRTNFERADLRNTNLTGSCIQDWIITESTKLDGVICDYVYLKWINQDKRDQMPPRGKFKPGGFVTFVRYILETVELYHEKDINPRLALNVLKKMSKDYDEPLDIVAVGKREERVFIKVKISENIDSETFKEDYFLRYDEDKKIVSATNKNLPSVDELVENKITEITSEQTNKISSINITQIEYIEVPKDLVIQGEVIVENIETGGETINQSGNFGIGYMSGGEITGSAKVAGIINEAENQNLADAAQEIQKLLEQLSKTHPTSTNKEKMTVVGEAVDQIENNPTLKGKVVNALKAGGTEAFKEAVNHPLVNILVATIEGWQNS